MSGLSDSLRLGDFGVPLYFDLAEDVSGNSNTIVFRAPDGTEIEKAATVGSSDVDSPIGELQASQYLVYTIADGDLSQIGTWEVWAVSEFGSTVRRSTKQRNLIVAG